MGSGAGAGGERMWSDTVAIPPISMCEDVSQWDAGQINGEIERLRTASTWTSLFAAARAWNAAGSKLDELAERLSEVSGLLAGAWSSDDSVAAQKALQRIHDTARDLAVSARAVHSFTDSSAATLQHAASNFPTGSDPGFFENIGQRGGQIAGGPIGGRVLDDIGGAIGGFADGLFGTGSDPNEKPRKALAELNAQYLSDNTRMPPEISAELPVIADPATDIIDFNGPGPFTPPPPPTGSMPGAGMSPSGIDAASVPGGPGSGVAGMTAPGGAGAFTPGSVPSGPSSSGVGMDPSVLDSDGHTGGLAGAGFNPPSGPGAGGIGGGIAAGPGGGAGMPAGGAGGIGAGGVGAGGVGPGALGAVGGAGGAPGRGGGIGAGGAGRAGGVPGGRPGMAGGMMPMGGAGGAAGGGARGPGGGGRGAGGAPGSGGGRVAGGAAGAGGVAGGARPGAAGGMMPMGGAGGARGAGGDDGGRDTWLVEDDDPWGADNEAPPGVIK